MRSSIVLGCVLVAAALAPAAAALPDRSPSFAVQHFEFTLPGLPNPCTAGTLTLEFVEDFYVHLRPDGTLNGIIVLAVTSADGWSNGGPRVIGPWIVTGSGSADVFVTAQNDRLTSETGGMIGVHINAHVVVVDGTPVVVRLDPPRLTCVREP